MPGLLGKKLGMTSLFDENGRNIACTLIEAGPCTVTQVKTQETDKYEAVQIGFGERKEKHTTMPMQGHFNKSGVTPKRLLKEFDFNPADYKPGDVLTVADVFEVGSYVDVVAVSKGKGFQGVVKRHGFAGVGGQTHGQHNRGRAPGSIGAASYPSRVFKGMRMGGQTGNKQVMIESLRVLKIVPEENLLVVSGSVPGPNGSNLTIYI